MDLKKCGLWIRSTAQGWLARVAAFPLPLYGDDEWGLSGPSVAIACAPSLRTWSFRPPYFVPELLTSHNLMRGHSAPVTLQFPAWLAPASPDGHWPHSWFPHQIRVRGPRLPRREIVRDSLSNKSWINPFCQLISVGAFSEGEHYWSPKNRFFPHLENQSYLSAFVQKSPQKRICSFSYRH